MKSNRATKRAWLISLLSVLMCAAMLVGTTFAWFTDTASTAVNRISAGNLDIEVEYAKEALDEDGKLTGEITPFQTVQDSTEVFDADAKWEPGRREYVIFRITNKGSLALKYQFSLNVLAQKAGINKDGDLYYLADYLCASAKACADKNVDYGSGYSGNEFMAIWNDLSAAGTTPALAEKPLSDAVFEGVLLAGERQAAAMVVWMPTRVGNEANAISPDKAATVDFGINVVASQYTYENDSFGPDYDENATYPATSSEALSEALDNLSAGGTVTVAPGAYEMTAASLPQGATLTGSGMGKTKLTAPATASGSKKTGLVLSQPGVTVSNVTLQGNPEMTSDMYYGVVDIREGGTTLENVEIVNRGTLASGIVFNRGIDAGDTVTVKNLKLNVYHRAFFIADNVNGTIEVDGADITGTVYALDVNSNSSQDLVLKFTNSKLHGWSSYGKIKSATFEKVEFSKGESDYDYLRPYADTVLKNCAFDAEFRMGAGTTGFTISIENSTFNGVRITAQNVKNMLDLDDRANLSGCTILVNGEAVTW